MYVAESMDGAPAVEQPSSSSYWLSVEEEADWLRNREELPNTFVGSLISCFVVHGLLLFLTNYSAGQRWSDGEQIRLPYRIVSLIHSVVISGYSMAWLLMGSESDRLFCFDTDTQGLMHLSAGYYLYSLIFYAMNVNVFPKHIIISMFFNNSISLVAATLQRLFPATIAIKTFHLLSLNNIPMAASSFLYLMDKAKVKLLIRIRAALSMLVAFAVLLPLNVGSSYTVCMYIYNHELWRVQVDERVGRYAIPFSAVLCCSAMIVGYTNFVFFSHSVEHVKTRYISPRGPVPTEPETQDTPVAPRKPSGVGSRNRDRPSAKAKHEKPR